MGPIFVLLHIQKMEAKSSSEVHYFRRFLIRWLPIAFTQTMFVHVSEREIFFSLKGSKFAVESD